MARKKRLKDDSEWRGIINLAGFGLILVFWPLLTDRVCELEVVAKSPKFFYFKDGSYFVFTIVTLLCTGFAAFAEHDNAKKQVAWIKSCQWPFIMGWLFAGVYLLVLILSSPALCPGHPLFTLK